MLERGGSFTLTEDGLRLVLEPLVQEPETEERDGFLIFTGTLDGPVPDHRDLRDEHLDRKAALSRT